MGLMDPLFGGKDKRSAARYEKARDVLETGDSAKMKQLAATPKTHPEMLYYLASNGDGDVRSLVAANEATPIQADEILAEDTLDDVREALALKIGRLLPDLPADARGDVGEKSLDILQKLASDELPKVRAIVANAIKNARHIPKDMALALARDVETTVSAPVLQYSPLLSDQDLTEIISAGAASGALDAIAKRANLSEDVSHDLVATLDREAIGTLLSNDSAQIREDTLDAIIDNAPEESSWHAPLAGRGELSLRAMKRISSFVASYLVSDMIERNQLEPSAAEEVLSAAREQIDGESVEDDLTAQWQAEAEALFAAGGIDDDAIRDFIKNNKRGLLIHCLAVAAEVSAQDASSMMRSKDGKLVTALAWKAGLTMRTAVSLQRSVALINANQVVYAKDGFDYPLEEKDMDWLLASHASE